VSPAAVEESGCQSEWPAQTTYCDCFPCIPNRTGTLPTTVGERPCRVSDCCSTVGGCNELCVLYLHKQKFPNGLRISAWWLSAKSPGGHRVEHRSRLGPWSPEAVGVDERALSSQVISTALELELPSRYSFTKESISSHREFSQRLIRCNGFILSKIWGCWSRIVVLEDQCCQDVV